MNDDITPENDFFSQQDLLEHADGYIASATNYVCKAGEAPFDIVGTRVTNIFGSYPTLVGLRAHLELVLSPFGAVFHTRSMWRTKDAIILVYLQSSYGNQFEDVINLFTEALQMFGVIVSPIHCSIDNKPKLVQ